MNLYRRHKEGCPGARKGRDYTKCNCPIWKDGRVNGVRIHQSMGCKDWDRAERMLDGQEAPTPGRQRLGPAIEAYIENLRVVRKRKQSTLTSYTHVLEALRDFAAAYTPAATFCDQITLVLLDEFRLSRKGRNGKDPMKGSSLRKETEHLRAFGKFCKKRGWAKENVAGDLESVDGDSLPTLPFDDDEIDAILAACGRIGNRESQEIKDARVRIRVFVQTLLWTGLRISDAAQLERGAVNIKTRRLTLRMMKTGTLLTMRLPEWLVQDLVALPERGKGKYFFWSGEGKLATVIGNLRQTLAQVFKLADVKGGHAHRFRDTYARIFLDTPGATIRDLQLKLGHSSVVVTEKHYGAFVKETQDRLDAMDDKMAAESARRLAQPSRQHGVRNAKSNVLTLPA
jgi:site-specific recombinase XerD